MRTSLVCLAFALVMLGAAPAATAAPACCARITWTWSVASSAPTLNSDTLIVTLYTGPYGQTATTTALTANFGPYSDRFATHTFTTVVPFDNVNGESFQFSVCVRGACYSSYNPSFVIDASGAPTIYPGLTPGISTP